MSSNTRWVGQLPARPLISLGSWNIEQEIVVICHSGKRRIFVDEVMQNMNMNMGYRKVVSHKTGLCGWPDYELPSVDGNEQEGHEDDADEYFTPKLRPDQISPK